MAFFQTSRLSPNAVAEVSRPVGWQDADWAARGQPGAQTREEQDALAAAHDEAQDTWFRKFLGKLFGRPEEEA